MGILAGDRHEHYLYAGWRLIETTNHVESSGEYSYSDSAVLNQFVWGTQYIDEPVRYDRNTDPGSDDDCLDSGGSAAYFYHQDANYRVVMLTDEAGEVLERYEYTPYGEPRVYAGHDATAAAELGFARAESVAGNPFDHQGLYRDRETGTCHNRFRQLHTRLGRFMQRDPLGYADGLSLYEYVGGAAIAMVDPYGLTLRVSGSTTMRENAQAALEKVCIWVVVDDDGWVSLDKNKTTAAVGLKKRCNKKTGDGGTPAPSEPPASQPAAIPTGCLWLQKLIDAPDSRRYKIQYGKGIHEDSKGAEGEYDPKTRTLYYVLKPELQYRSTTGETWLPEPWEILWHEVVHAVHHEKGKLKYSTIQELADEEYNTINETNPVVQAGTREDGSPVPARDPLDHDTIDRARREEGWTPPVDKP